MQVGNVYAEIKVVGSDKNIITFDNLRLLQIVETAGASLPYVCGSFFTLQKEGIANLFQQNNQIIIMLGTSAEDAEAFTVTLVNSQPPQTDQADSGYIVYFGGFFGPLDLMTSKISKAYPGNSYRVIQEVIREKLGTHILTDGTTIKVNENPVNWMQTQESCSSFLINTLMHMDMRPSFPLFAFDKNLNFHLKSFNEVRAQQPKFYFTPYSPEQTNQIQYLKNFNVDSYKMSYNLYSGYNKVTEIYNSVSGIPQHIIDENEPILAATTESEGFQAGTRVTYNKIQSSNVHKTYNEAFVYNSNKLVALSSMQGCLMLGNYYYPEIRPLDLVHVSTGGPSNVDNTHDGLYLVDTIVTNISFMDNTISTYVYVARDNKNNVEDFVTVRRKRIEIPTKFLQDLNDAVVSLRMAAAVAGEVVDGRYLDRLREFGTSTKNNFLRMFSVAGITLDFTGQINFLQNALLMANSLMNSLLAMILPTGLYLTFRDFLINKPSMRELLEKAIMEYVPSALQDLIFQLLHSLLKTNDALNSIARANGVTVKGTTEGDEEVAQEIDIEEQADERVIPIIEDFERNTEGIDIPFPIITLDESRSLLPEKELRDYVANETIANLTDLGYMEGVDIDKFKDILLNGEIDYNTINQINQNAGNKMNYRFWGTYGPGTEALYAWTCGDKTAFTKTTTLSAFTRFYNNNYSPNMEFKTESVDGTYKVFCGENEAERDEKQDINSDALVQLTEFYIKNGFKDRYKTIPCTKLISATQNARIFFACPESEEDIKFYINSKRVILDHFPTYLGYTDVYGNKIRYNVYYTTTGYNSNSVLFEVRQGV